MRKLYLLKNRIQILLDGLYAHAVMWCYNKGILFDKHSVHDRILKCPPPRPCVYKDFEVFRVKGKFEYLMQYFTAINEEWYYLKGHPNKIVYTICCDRYAECEITMRANVSQFLFHPPQFAPSVWIKKGAPGTVFNYISIPNELLCFTGCVIEKEVKAKRCTIDLNRLCPQIKFVKHVDACSREELNMFAERTLQESVEALSRNLEESVEELNELVSGVKEDYTLSQMREVAVDLVCPICRHTVMKCNTDRYGSFYYCGRHGNPNATYIPPTPKGPWGSVQPYHISHVEWMKKLEEDREELRSKVLHLKQVGEFVEGL